MSDPKYPESHFAPNPPMPPEGSGIDPLSVGALVTSVLGFGGLCAYGVGGLLGLVGAILGHVALGRDDGRRRGGAGMALAAVITGWVVFAVGVLIMSFVAWVLFKEDGLLNHAFDVRRMAV